MNQPASRKKASIVNLLFNYANAIFAIVNGLVLVPLYLQYFSVSTYGSYLSSGNIVAMVGLLEGGTSMVLTQKLSASFAKGEYKTFSRLIGSGLFLSVCITCILIVVGLALFPFIADWVKAEPSEYRNIQYAFLISAIGAGLSISLSNVSAIFQSWLKVHISGYANLVSIIIGILSTIIGLKTGLGVVAVPLGILARNLLGILILVFALIKILYKENYPKIHIDKNDSLSLLKSSIPILGSNVSKSLVMNSQLLIITNFINPSSSAIFFITGRIYTVCDYFLAPIGSSIFSSMAHIVGEGNIEKIKENLLKVFTLFTAFSTFVLTGSLALNHSFINIWVGPDKFGGELLSALLCLSMLISSRFKFLEFNLFALGVFGKTVLYDLISGAIRIVLIFVLIKYIGYIAMPVAELLANTLLLGYFLNKLLIEKLRLNSAESLKFPFLGGIVFLILFVMAIIWATYYPYAGNWFKFIFEAAVFAFINIVIIVLITKQLRTMLFELLNKFKQN